VRRRAGWTKIVGIASTADDHLRARPAPPIVVRRATAEDLDALRSADAPGVRHHVERFAAQEAGWCDYLLAVDGGDVVVGHVVVRRHSKYPPVVNRLGEFPEVQALAAYPTGFSIGSLLLDAAEDIARRRGANLVGLGVERANIARQLYERRGYRDWGYGTVVDDWSEVANDGSVVAQHHDVCDYLVLDLQLASAGSG
jgi:GNAT superfamily N-acetyltransferase